LTHPELYAAYPDTAKIPSGLFASRVPEGSYHAPTDSILAGGPSTGSQRSAMLHEIQHAVQQREGFAKGGSPEMFSMPNQLKEGMHSYEDMRRAALLLERANRDGVTVTSLNPRWATDKIKSIAQTYEKMPQGMDVLTKNIKLRLQIDDPIDAYQRLAGEAEARAVQKRRDLTNEERKAIFPLQSYDVPIKELIFR
jgi:hypothetical protein